MSWLLAHWMLVLGWVMFAMSEALPFLPQKANGIVQMILNVLKAIVAQKALPPGDKQ